ncbi:DUF4347 domain-containing protein [Vreelandella lionensis]|uniref:DUF4347 domain-containing protein n=1 Tax=Vreelandella lionensis TaxID=1144478 RepID=A0ABW8BSS7_9GAMM
MTAHTPSRQIAAIDTSIAGHEALIHDARAQGMEILLLSGDSDGIEELAAKLSGTQNVDGLHLFTHGSEGQIHMGDDVLSSESLTDHAEALALIRGSFSEEGDLLVYGCDVGAGEQGRQFVEELALVTGADVAASDDLTGNHEQGGDWELETSTGIIGAHSLMKSDHFNGVLATPGDGVRNFSGFADTGNTLISSYFSVSAGQLGASPVPLPVDVYTAQLLAYIDPADTGYSIDNGDPFYFEVAADGTNIDTFQLTSLVAAEYSGMDFGNLTITGYLKEGGTVTSQPLTSTGLDNDETWTFDAGSLSSFVGRDLTKFRLAFDELESSSGSPYNAEISISSFEFRSFGISNAAAPATNTAPSFENSDPGTLSIDETSTDTTSVVHDINANDGDGGGTDSVTYTITAGNDSGAFSIDTDDGEIRLAYPAALDFESTSSYTLTIQANDGEDSNNTATQDITINVNDIAPAITATANPFSTVAENVANGTSVGTPTLTAASDDDNVTWSIVSGNTDSAFAIDGMTGAITVNDTSQIDYETASSFALEVQATDGTTPVTETMNVDISDINEAPSGTGALTTTTLNDNAGATALFQNLTVADPDAGENDLTLTITLSDSAAGSLDTSGVWSTSDGGTTYIATGLTVAEASTALDNASFTPANNSGQNGSFNTDLTVQIDDGDSGNQTVLATQTLTINRVNDAPVFTALDGTPSFTEGGAPVALDTDVSVADSELGALNGGNGDFSGATLTLARNGGANTNDQFAFNNGGASFTVVGGDLQYGDQTFATFTSTGGTLTVNFTSSATPATTALVNEVLQVITYANGSDDPASTVDLSWTFADGDGGNDSGSTQVSITNVNDAPKLNVFGEDPTYIEGAAAADLFSGLDASTVEAADRFTAMTLTVTNVADGSNEILRFDGTDVALVAGTTMTDMNGLIVNVSVTGGTATVSFTGANLTTAQMETLVDSMGYRNSSDNPTTAGDRVVTITGIADSGGGTNTAAPNMQSTVTLTAVNNPPQVGSVDGETSQITAGSGAVNVGLFDDATVANADTDDYNGGTLTIAQPSGTANGFWGLDGTNATSGGDGTIAAGETVSIGGHAIGTVHVTNDGQAGNTLQITFDANASNARVQNLLESLTYSAPSGLGDRTFTLTLNDNDGTANSGDEDTTATFTLSVTPNPPLIGALSGDTGSASNGQTVRFDQDGNVTVTDLDSGDFNGGNLTITKTGALEGNFSLDGDVTSNGNGTIAAGQTIAVGGTNIGSVTTDGQDGNDLVITFDTADATPARVQTLLRALGYTSTDGGAHTFSTTITDATGVNAATSAAATSTINVEAAPINTVPGTQTGIDGTAQALTGISVADADSANVTTTVSVGAGEGSFTATGDATVTGGSTHSIQIVGSVADVNATLATLQYTPAVDAAGNQTITVLSSDGTNQDSDTISVTVNDRPTIGNLDGDSVTFTEGGGAVPLDVDGDATFNDNNNPPDFNNGNLTVTMAGGVGADDVLSVGGSVTLGGTTAGSDVQVGGMTIGTLANDVSGGNDFRVDFNLNATTERVTTLLRSLGYTNASDTPTAETKTITVSVNDGDGATSIANSVVLTKVAVNDAPTLTANAADPTFTEDGSAASLFSGTVIDTVESADTISELTLTVANLADGSDELLSVDDTEIALTDGTSGTTMANGVGYLVSLSGTTATVALTKSDSTAKWQALVNGLAYRNTSDNPTVAADRTVTLTSVKDDGGTANGGADTTALAINSLVSLSAVNDAPVFTTSTTLSVAENATVVTTLAATDADGDTLTYSLTGGADMGLFSLDANSGALSFKAAPDFEAPNDQDQDNQYEVVVNVSDGTESASQAMTIAVTDVNETPPSGPGPTPPPIQVTPPEPQPNTPSGQPSVSETISNNGATSGNVRLVENTGNNNVVTATLPGRMTLVHEGARTATDRGLALEDLIASINGKTPTNLPDQTGVASQWLASRPEGTLLDIRTLTFSGTAPSSVPIVLTGTGSGNGVVANQEAFVIDVSGLPQGQQIQLDNIDFASIVGSTTILGGAGDNVVIGDDASQYIVLGAGDDELHGGGGDDTIGSEGGDDRLFGDSGNDELFGGTGADQLHGGSDTDTVSYAGNREDYVVTQAHSVITVQSKADPGDIDTLINLESLVFADETLTVSYEDDLAWITGLYAQVLGRQGDVSGVQYWAQQYANGMSRADIALSILNSPESGRLAEEGSDYLDVLYTGLLGRVADASGKAYWSEQAAGGATLRDIVDGFMQSEEMGSHHLSAIEWDFFV